MRTLRDIPIKQKLMIIIMATTTAALLLAASASWPPTLILFRGYLRRDLSALARIIADNSTAALAFNDPKPPPRRWARCAPERTSSSPVSYRPDGTVLAQLRAQRRQPRLSRRRTSDDLRFGHGWHHGFPSHYLERAPHRDPDAASTIWTKSPNASAVRRHRLGVLLASSADRVSALVAACGR